MSDIAPNIFPFLVAALEDERRELDQCILFLIGKLPAQLPRSTPLDAEITLSCQMETTTVATVGLDRS